MARKQAATTRRFFKVMMPGFNQKLNLPPAISEELEKCKPERAILESCIGKWKIGLCRNCETNLICFDQGWPQFVDRHSLSIGDFIVFEPTTDHLHFNVYVFDPSACEKEFRAEAEAEAKTKKKKKKAYHESLNPTIECLTSYVDPQVYAEDTPYFVKTMMDDEDEAWCFKMRMVAYHATKYGQVSIPTTFMRRNKLGKQKSASLRDPRGREWWVNLTYGGPQLRQRMCGGWRDFYAANALKDGDTCVFKLLPQNPTQTTIFFDVQIRH